MSKNYLNRWLLPGRGFTDKSNSNKRESMEVRFSIHGGIQSVVPLLSRTREKVRHFLEGTRACEVFDIYCGLIEESYILKLFLISVVVSCILPILAFTAFAVVSFITTFTGFLLLEGSLLILGACAIILWFGAVGIFFILTATVIMLFYLVYRHAGDIAYKIERFYFSSSSESMDDDMVVVDTDHED